MSARSLWHALGLAPRKDSEVWSADEFFAVLDRERARVHRSAIEFSLVVFCVETADAAGRLMDVLVRRVRRTDQLGRLSGHRIGVILIDSPIEGAWRFADSVSALAAAEGLSPSCSVYSYPSHWLSGGDGQLDRKDGLAEEPERRAPGVACTSPGPRAGKQTAATAMAGLGVVLAHGLPAWKRALDVVLALLGLILLSPVLLGVAILIKITSPGPVFFRQQRLGHLRKPFTLWKFRTMEPDADPSAHRAYLQRLMDTDQPLAKLDGKDDPRIIPTGRFLRDSCLDELPQLLNVLKGEMSLIGPRPCLDYEADDYLLWQTGRFDTVPGMTGLWQVAGKSDTTFNEMMRLDIRYAQRRSLWLDLKILLKTIPAIVTDR